ncbi:hypothetical protein ACLKA6_018040 [Drosophila palustris]
MEMEMGVEKEEKRFLVKGPPTVLMVNTATTTVESSNAHQQQLQLLLLWQQHWSCNCPHHVHAIDAAISISIHMQR